MNIINAVYADPGRQESIVLPLYPSAEENALLGKNAKISLSVEDVQAIRELDQARSFVYTLSRLAFRTLRKLSALEETDNVPIEQSWAAAKHSMVLVFSGGSRGHRHHLSPR